jgi:hypothetical protein
VLYSYIPLVLVLLYWSERENEKVYVSNKVRTSMVRPEVGIVPVLQVPLVLVLVLVCTCTSKYEVRTLLPVVISMKAYRTTDQSYYLYPCTRTSKYCTLVVGGTYFKEYKYGTSTMYKGYTVKYLYYIVVTQPV